MFHKNRTTRYRVEELSTYRKLNLWFNFIYNCGDFVNGYAIDEQYWNDLEALFHLHLTISPLSLEENQKSKSIDLHSLSIFPTRRSNFEVNRLNFEDNDWTWIKENFVQLSNIDG
jgi:hypothetical protein